jgi:hypothetical protein
MAYLELPTEKYIEQLSANKQGTHKFSSLRRSRVVDGVFVSDNVRDHIDENFSIGRECFFPSKKGFVDNLV